MVFADEIRNAILKLVAERGPEGSFAVSDVAQSIDRNNWKDLLDQVNMVANVLIKEGKISRRFLVNDNHPNPRGHNQGD